MDKIRHIPCTIVQGRYDMVCPAETAWLLHKVIFSFMDVELKYMYVTFMFILSYWKKYIP